MDSDEPSLVPQWLKGGAGNGAAYGSKEADSDPSHKKSPFSNWDSKNSTRRNSALDSRGTGDKSWKSQTNKSKDSPGQRDTFTTARDNSSAPHRDFNGHLKDHFNNHSGHTNGSRAVRPGHYDRTNGFVDKHDDFGTPSVRSRQSFGPRSAASISLHRTDSAPEGRLREYRADSDHRGGAHKPSFDRDFPSLARQTYVPREAPTKQHFLTGRGSSSWNSRLADAPAAPTHPVQHATPQLHRSLSNTTTATPFINIPATSQAVTSPTSSTTSQPAISSPPTTTAPAEHVNAHPRSESDSQPQHQPPSQAANVAQRMAEALQQAQAPSAAVDRSRLEQLQVKQSQKLIPVLAVSSKAKAPNSKPHSNTAAAKAPSIQRSSSLGPATATSASGRPSIDQPKGAPTAPGIATATSGTATAPANGLLTLKLAAPAGERAKGRSHFFESLRRRSTASDQAQQQPDDDLSVAVTELVGLQLVGLGTADHQQHDQCPDDQQHDQCPGTDDDAQAEEDAAETGAPADAVEEDAVDSAALLGPSAEEEAFLRSLGWTEASDDEADCGLTEEEIAAFKAAAELRAKLPCVRSKEGSSQLLLANGTAIGFHSIHCSSSDDESEAGC